MTRLAVNVAACSQLAVGVEAGGAIGGGGQFYRAFVSVKPARGCVELMYFVLVAGGSQEHLQKCIF
jgi:hypothetical protein